MSQKILKFSHEKETVVTTTGKDGKKYYYKLDKNGKKTRISSSNKEKTIRKKVTKEVTPVKKSKKKYKDGYVLCQGDKNGNLRVYQMAGGIKVRLPNNFHSDCTKRTLKTCPYLCDKDDETHYTPCKLHKTTFTNRKQVDEYCSLRKKGPYDRETRDEIIRRANLELEEDKKMLNASTRRKIGSGLKNKSSFPVGKQGFVSDKTKSAKKKVQISEDDFIFDEFYEDIPSKPKKDSVKKSTLKKIILI
jgi:hypothetical protein